jgi:alanine racemase
MEWTYDGSEGGICRLYDRYRNFDLAVDSRLVTRPNQTLFLALPGRRSDGHDYIPELIGKGVAHFVVETGYIIQPNEHHLTFIRAPEPLEVLQRLARHHRQQFPELRVVGITGSNGKTIVKDWLAQVMAVSCRVCASPRSYNSRIGVPLSVWRIKEDDEVAIFEAGISRPGDMKVLRNILQPTCGILTHIGTAHLANFADSRELLKEKWHLFTDTEWVIVGSEVPGLEDTATADGPGLLHVRELAIDVALPDHLTGIYRNNARTVAAAAVHLGLDRESLEIQLRQLQPLKNRLERRLSRYGTPLINDSYSNDYTALVAAIAFAREQDPFDHLTLILGTVQPMIDYVGRLSALLGKQVDQVILLGETNRSLAAGLDYGNYFSNVAELLAALPRLSLTDTTILVKGASYERLDRVVDHLSQRQHRTVLQISLPAILANLRYYRDQLPDGMGMVVMAKASAYGSGALPVAQLLQTNGVDYLAVAYADEGRELRAGGIRLPIMVLNAEESEFGQLSEYDLEPIVHSLSGLRAASDHGLAIHLEVDTGMSRLGFLPEELGELAVLRGDLPRVASFFTHLAASENAEQREFTLEQFDRFDRAYRIYRQHGGPPAPRHALNTNGISAYPRYAYDMVRLGIGLYGIGDKLAGRRITPVHTLITRITAIRELSEPATVGYGRLGHIEGTRRIAVLAIGYADGLPRLCGQGRFCFSIRGRLAPTIGAICMDMCTVDLELIPEARVHDEAIVFGYHHPIERLAESCKTIPYEILTGIGPRVHRLYVED